MKISKKACLVVCMHRSGSSALSGLVSSLGAAVGSNIMPPKHDNPKGFWENQSIVDLNDEILGALGCRWDLPSVQSWQSCVDTLNNSFFERAKTIVEAEFGPESELILMKDPRLVNLLPFWMQVLTELRYECKVIFIYRHPEEVYLSLKKRNGFTRNHSHTLWLDSLISFCYFSNEPSLMVSFDAVMEDHRRVAMSIKDFLSIDDKSFQSGLDEFSEKYFDENLYHQKVSRNHPDSSVVEQLYRFISLESDLRIADEDWLQAILAKKNDLESEIETYRSKLFLHLTTLISGYEPESLSAEDVRLSTSENGLLALARERVERSADVSKNVVRQFERFHEASESWQSQVLRNLESEAGNAKRTRDELVKVNSNLEFLYADLEKERKANDWLREKLDEEINGRIWLQSELKRVSENVTYYKDLTDNLRGRLASLLGAYENTIRQVRMSKRWKAGDKFVAWFQSVRLNKSVFPQFSIAEEHIERHSQWLASESGGIIENGSEVGVDLHALKKQHSTKAKEALSVFLEDTNSFDFPQHDSSDLTVIIVLYNKAELTYLCLKSLIQHNTELKYELVIVDNASSDSTNQLLDNVSGIKIINNEENVGFLLACNQALEFVNSPAVLFLNNDVELTDGCLDKAYETLYSDSTIGVVGGKIILLDGKLQEAGSLVWADGSCCGYGRDNDPNSFEYQFQRNVDYVSGAFLMTKLELLEQTKGFDECYVPAYYEEVDYCFEVEKLGYRCVYDPRVSVRHYEFGSIDLSNQAHDLMVQNRDKFAQKHQLRLSKHLYPDSQNILLARSTVLESDNRRHILYIDDRVPHGYFGSGFPRSNSMLNNLIRFANAVTMIPLNFPYEETLASVYTDIDRCVEVAHGIGRENFKKFLGCRLGYYDILWISRPHNLEFVLPILDELNLEMGANYKPKIVYDAEAIFADRQKSLALVRPDEVSDSSVDKSLRDETLLAGQADAVIAVCEQDRQVFKKNLPSSILTFRYGFVIDASPNDAKFHDRNGLLFVGNLDRDKTPNVDSLLWFYEKAWPTLKSRMPDVTLDIIGSNQAISLGAIKDEQITFHGRVDDIDEYYAKSKAFIAPTRFAAGIPYKLHEAAAKGLPCIATDLLVNQSGWENGIEVLSAKVDDEKTFSDHCIELLTNEKKWLEIRSNALNKIHLDCSKTQATRTLEAVIEFLE